MIESNDLLVCYISNEIALSKLQITPTYPNIERPPGTCDIISSSEVLTCLSMTSNQVSIRADKSAIGGIALSGSVGQVCAPPLIVGGLF